MKTNVRDTIRKISRYLVLFTGFLVAVVLTVMYAYAVVSILPIVFSYFVSSFSVYASTVVDIAVALGPGLVFLGVLSALGSYQLLKRLYIGTISVCHRVCIYFSLEEAPVSDNGSAEVKVASKKTRIMFLVICVAILGLFIWRLVATDMETQSVSDEQSAITSDMLTYEGPYPTVDELGLTDGLDSVNLTEWEQADVNAVIDTVDSIVAELSEADDFSQHVYFGLDVAGDMESVSNSLLEYMLLDVDESVVSALFKTDSEGVPLNGVGYDMLFDFVTSEDGTVSWMQSDSLAGLSGAEYIDRVNMIYSDGVLYVSNAPEEPDGDLPYAYSAQQTDSMSDHRANVGFSLMSEVLNNHSVSDLTVYTRTTECGTDYYWTGLQTLSRVDYDGMLTKSVLLECVADGSYEMTVVYSVDGEEPGGEMVIRVDTDTTDVTVSVPDASEVRYLTDNM